MVDTPDYDPQLDAMLGKLSPRERKRYEKLHEETRAWYEQRLQDARDEYARHQQEFNTDQVHERPARPPRGGRVGRFLRAVRAELQPRR